MRTPFRLLVLAAALAGAAPPALADFYIVEQAATRNPP